MAYSREFFSLQIDFADRLSSRFGLPLGTVLWDYTTLSRTLGAQGEDDRRDFASRVQTAADRVTFTCNFYARRNGPHDVPRSDGTFHGHRLFGHWYYEVREGSLVRPHFVRLEDLDQGPFSPERRPVALQNLAEMFGHIRVTCPEASHVQGNSWMYNLASYRALFPPEYTSAMEVGKADEFQFLALWGQFYDRAWRVRVGPAGEMLDRLGRLERLEDLGRCFPLQVLQPRCPITHFYRHYGISTEEGA